MEPILNKALFWDTDYDSIDYKKHFLTFQKKNSDVTIQSHLSNNFGAIKKFESN